MKKKRVTIFWDFGPIRAVAESGASLPATADSIINNSHPNFNFREVECGRSGSINGDGRYSVFEYYEKD